MCNAFAAQEIRLIGRSAAFCGLARINPKVRLPMILERLTAWTLVIVYYTVTCGAILLGLKGAL
jgi:hypothetical protein